MYMDSWLPKKGDDPQVRFFGSRWQTPTAPPRTTCANIALFRDNITNLTTGMDKSHENDWPFL